MSRSILNFFSGDIDKARLWMNTENPMFGNIRPVDMVIMGRGEKLLKFIDASLEANEYSAGTDYRDNVEQFHER